MTGFPISHLHLRGSDVDCPRNKQREKGKFELISIKHIAVCAKHQRYSCYAVSVRIPSRKRAFFTVKNMFFFNFKNAICMHLRQLKRSD